MLDDNKMSKFWLQDPKALFSNFNVIPNSEMTNAERLNAITRLLLLITVGMYFLGYDQYFTVLTLGILMIIVLHSTCKTRENFRPHRGRSNPCGTCGLDSSLAYINTKYEETPVNQFTHVNDHSVRSYANAKYTVIPVDTPQPFREIWRKEPSFCSEFTTYPESYTVSPINDVQQPRSKCNYADREYIDVLPGNTCCDKKGLVSARPAVESAFLRDSMEFRNYIMGEYVERFGRERQHNCVDFKPGRKTF